MTTQAAVQPQRRVDGQDVNVTGRRIAATLIDGVVLGLLYSVSAQVFGTITWTWDDGLSGSASVPVAVSITYGLVAFAYFVLLEGSRGATFGKMAVGIKVVDEVTGGRPSWTQALLRTILRLVDGIAAYLVAYIAVLSTPRRQRIGDLTARTLVVRRTG